MNKITIERLVKESLNTNVCGLNEAYFIYHVFGLERCDIEPVIIEAIENKIILPTFASYFNSENCNVYSFAIWKTPDAAQYFSNYFPGCLVVEETNWNNNYLKFFINGTEAVPGQDYKLELKYEENLSLKCSWKSKYYDITFKISDVYGNNIKSNASLITKDELDDYIRNSTSSKEPVLSDIEKE